MRFLSNYNIVKNLDYEKTEEYHFESLKYFALHEMFMNLLPFKS